MRFDRGFGLRSAQGFVASALLCAACASGSDDPETVPAWMGPDPNASAPSSAVPSAAGGSTSEPTAPDVTPVKTPAASSETPVTPQLDPGLAGSGGASAANGSEQGAAGTGGAIAGEAGAGGTPADGAATQPRPSAMCGSGGGAPVFNLPNTLFSVPPGYDGTTPLPVVMAFHAAGNPNTQLRGILGDTLDDDYIVFYPKSDGNGWSDQADSPKVDAMFAALDALACYDQNRVFATGHSSGAQFIVQRLCAGESRWRAVAPVASSVYCSSWTPIPALVIHGIGDTERQAYGLDDGDGLKDIVPYRTSNGCQESFTEVPVQGCTSGGVQVDPGCRDFDGCGERTRWCQHNDPQYGTSHHGVPCFGARVIKDFLDSFR
jgi:hypothetical protein